MGSHLSIAKLPYRLETVNVAHSNMSAQFTQGNEIILSIKELEILLMSQYLLKVLKFRDLEASIEEVQYLLDNPDKQDNLGNPIETLDYIRSQLLKRYYSPEAIRIENEVSNPLKILEGIKPFVDLEKKSLEVSLKHKEDLIEWAKKYFIEGEHYIYSL